MAVTWLFTILFLGMIGYITYYSMTHQQELINNSYNGRQQSAHRQPGGGGMGV